jgi:hypothetical protein
MSTIHTFIRATKHMHAPMTFHLDNPNLPHIMKTFGKYAIKNNYFIVHNLSDKYRYLIPKLEKINQLKGDNIWTFKSFEHIVTK